jgi:hypothetical protein
MKRISLRSRLPAPSPRQVELPSMTDDRKRRGGVFWAAVVACMAVLLVVTAVLTVGIMFGLMHGDNHAYEWLAAALQRGQRRRD